MTLTPPFTGARLPLPAEEWRKSPSLFGMLKQRGRPTHQRRHITASLVATNGAHPPASCISCHGMADVKAPPQCCQQCSHGSRGDVRYTQLPSQCPMPETNSWHHVILTK